REPLISHDIESQVYGYLTGKANHLGCITHAIGGIEDHIHLVISIPPKISIAECVKALKGSSAHYCNQSLPNLPQKFIWQEGYGIFSLSANQLSVAIDYVNNQKVHHLNKTTIRLLEEETD
ncbi:IS200/IS605 family transposase, partial [Cylindrospermopsis raciborskii]|uniref:IS200/IS605 family transposase n=1 Tax=Cylindrospermopsis raciborskii TaxID=77022 RepID=UPI0038CF45E1